MTRTTWRRTAFTMVLALVLGWLLSMGTASAEETGALDPSFGDGKLTIIGSGFKAGERVTITADVDGVSRQFTVVADARGGFQLATGLAVRPGASLMLDARGDKGTAVAVITAAPSKMPKAPPSPSQLPRTGGLNPLVAPAVALGVALIGAGSTLLSHRQVGKH